jgi:cobalamin biosynthesis protein CobW
VTVDGVVAVVDGPALAQGRFAADEAAVAAQRAADPNLDHDDPIEELFEDQLACADLVLLNKSDALDEAQVRALAAELAPRLRRGTRLIATRHGQIDVQVLLGLVSAAEDDIANRPSHHEMEGEADHDHDDFESFVVPVAEVADRAAVLARIGAAPWNSTPSCGSRASWRLPGRRRGWWCRPWGRASRPISTGRGPRRAARRRPCGHRPDRP